MPAVQQSVELVEGARGGVVAATLEAREQEVALAVDLLGRQLRLERQLGGEPEQLAPEARQRRGADLRVIRLAGGAELAAQPGHRLRQVGAAAPGRALHHHRVDEVREPGGLGRLPARAHPDQQRHGHHGRHVALAHDHAEPVRQPHPANVVARLRGRQRRHRQRHEQRRHEAAPAHRALSGRKRTRT